MQLVLKCSESQHFYTERDRNIRYESGCVHHSLGYIADNKASYEVGRMFRRPVRRVAAAQQSLWQVYETISANAPLSLSFSRKSATRISTFVFVKICAFHMKYSSRTMPCTLGSYLSASTLRTFHSSGCWIFWTASRSAAASTLIISPTPLCLCLTISQSVFLPSLLFHRAKMNRCAFAAATPSFLHGMEH